MRKCFRKHVEIAPYEENSLDRFRLQTFCVYRSFYISVHLLMRKKSRKNKFRGTPAWKKKQAV